MTQPGGITLVPLTETTLRALVERPDAPLTQAGLARQQWPEGDRRVLRYRAAALAADATSWPWLLHAVVDDSGRVVGRVGCHSAPVDGRVEVGYAVVPGVRRRGVATSALEGFCTWLRANGVHTVVLTVGPGNTASLAVAGRAGFVQVGERWDEEDGLELVLERTLG